jgi:hypothetical protein
VPLQVEDLALPPSEGVGDGHSDLKLLGQVLADGRELLARDEPGSGVGLPQLLDHRRTLELPVLERQPQQFAQGR